jgi:hypothetical protein
MPKIIRSLSAAGFVLAAAAVASFAQQPQTVRVTGTIEKVDGATLVIKPRQGGEVKVNVTDKVAVFGVVKASLADVKPGAYIGVGAMPQADGSQRAIQVTVFADVQRGLGEGHRPWNRPNSTMTNATIDSTVAGVDGAVVMVKYKDGEQKIVIPPDATILGYVVGDKSELKPGADIGIGNAMKQPDGTLEAARVNVGRGGVVPQ